MLLMEQRCWILLWSFPRVFRSRQGICVIVWNQRRRRGAGIYWPKELVGYTISAMEVAQRGVGADPSSSTWGGSMMVDALSESQTLRV